MSVHVFRHVPLLNDNAQSHTSKYVMQFLKSEKVTALPAQTHATFLLFFKTSIVLICSSLQIPTVLNLS